MCGDGDIHIYLGTSAWVAACSRTADKFKHGAAAIQSADKEMNLIAGITESAGANIEWLKNQFFRKEMEELGDGIYDYMDSVVADIPPGSDHLICTPWMLGERCPVSSTTTRATLFNMTMIHTREHIMRAMYEGIGYTCGGFWRTTGRITVSGATISASSAAVLWTKAGCRLSRILRENILRW